MNTLIIPKKAAFCHLCFVENKVKNAAFAVQKFLKCCVLILSSDQPVRGYLFSENFMDHIHCALYAKRNACQHRGLHIGDLGQDGDHAALR